MRVYLLDANLTQFILDLYSNGIVLIWQEPIVFSIHERHNKKLSLNACDIQHCSIYKFKREKYDQFYSQFDW